jgi:hypothetical protein
MSAKLDGAAVTGRTFGQPDGAAVDEVVAGAVLAVVLTAPELLPSPPEEHDAPSRRPTAKTSEKGKRAMAPSLPAAVSLR